MAAPGVQIWEMRPDARYVLAHQHGPTYTGPMGACGYTSGVLTHHMGHPCKFVLGSQTKGARGLAVVWEYRDGYEVRWAGDAWKYDEKAKPEPVPPVAVEDPPGPAAATATDWTDLSFRALQAACKRLDVKADGRKRDDLVRALQGSGK